MNVTVRPALRPVCIFTIYSPGVVWLLPVTPSFYTHAARHTPGGAARCMTSAEAKDPQRAKPCCLACRGCATVAAVLGDVDVDVRCVVAAFLARLEAGLELHTFPPLVCA
jgi:hypothetical protein